MEYLAIVGLFGGLIAIIVWAIKYGKKVNARKQLLFEEFAQRKGLTHSTTKHFLNVLNTVDGTLNNCHFQLQEVIVGSGKHQHVMAHINFFNTPINFDFKIGKEHIFSKAGKMLGMQDVEIGDEEFDKRFLLKSKSENEFRDLITYEIQDELKRLDKDLKSSISQKDGVLSYSVHGGLVNEKIFKSTERVIEFMIKLMSKRR